MMANLKKMQCQLPNSDIVCHSAMPGWVSALTGIWGLIRCFLGPKPWIVQDALSALSAPESVELCLCQVQLVMVDALGGNYMELL